MIHKLLASPKRLFLIDSMGGFLSTFLLLVLLVGFQEAFGMPQPIAYLLAAIAFIFGIYSLCCFFFVSNNWRPWLMAIAIANTAYCLLTLGLVFYFHRQLTVLCEVYFLLELVVIVFLVRLEWKCLKK